MRSDNSRHLVAAAQKRAEQTRRRAVAALRRVADGSNPASPSMPSPARPASPGPGSTPNPTCEPRSSSSAPGTSSAHRPLRHPSGNEPPTPLCCGGSRPLPNGSVASSRTTSSCAPPSPKPSENTVRPPSPVAARPAATRRRNPPPRFSNRADTSSFTRLTDMSATHPPRSGRPPGARLKISTAGFSAQCPWPCGCGPRSGRACGGEVPGPGVAHLWCSSRTR